MFIFTVILLWLKYTTTTTMLFKFTNLETRSFLHSEYENNYGEIEEIQIQIHLFGHIADPGDLC